MTADGRPRCGKPTRNGPCGRAAGHNPNCVSAAALERSRYVPLGELTLCGVPVRPSRRVPPAPSGEVLPVIGARLALCPFCAGDHCWACLGGPCKCACQDGEP